MEACCPDDTAALGTTKDSDFVDKVRWVIVAQVEAVTVTLGASWLYRWKHGHSFSSGGDEKAPQSIP